jgi:phosphoserine phosphatase
MAKILLIRHGHVEGIEPPRFRGREQLPLTARGHAEASAAARRIASAWRPSAVYTSPLARCIATGDAIAQKCNVPAAVCDDLNDIDYGAWQFRSYEEMRREEPNLFAAWFATPHLVRFPGGESLQDIVARSANALRRVLSRHPDGTPCEVAAAPRCRSHLRADLRLRRPVDLSWQHTTLEELSVRLAQYEASFVASADEPNNQDRAALIAAAGWCSGWRPLLTLLSPNA